MAKKQFPTDLLEQAVSAQDAWSKIDPELALAGQKIDALVSGIEGLRRIDDALKGLENDMTEMRNQRDALQETIWNMLKRLRITVKALYGDDSPQYELVGGTRTSERKSPRRNGQPVE